MAKEKRLALRIFQALPSVIAAVARFRSAPALNISAPIPIPDAQPAPQPPANTDRAVQSARGKALAALQGRSGPDIDASFPAPKPAPPQSAKPLSERAQREIPMSNADAYDTLTGKNGLGSHALPYWPSTKMQPGKPTLRRLGRQIGPEDAALEGLRDPTFEQQTARLKRPMAIGEPQPFPDWVKFSQVAETVTYHAAPKPMIVEVKASGRGASSDARSIKTVPTPSPRTALSTGDGGRPSSAPAERPRLDERLRETSSQSR